MQMSHSVRPLTSSAGASFVSASAASSSAAVKSWKPTDATPTAMADPEQTKSPEVDFEKHPSGIVPQLQNVVATCYLGRKLDLKHIAMHARNAEYNPKRFAAVIMRIRDPKTTALVFSSGKMVCTGAKSEQEVRFASRKFARMIQKLGFEDAKFKDFKVQNIVGSCDAKFPIRLEGLHFKHSMFSSYEPELFPGLIYRMKMPKVVLLIFVSGKVVLTGAKTREEIYDAFETIYPALVEFRKGDVVSTTTPVTSEAVGPGVKRSASAVLREDSEIRSFNSIMSNINSLHSAEHMSNSHLVRSLGVGTLSFGEPQSGGSDRKRPRMDSSTGLGAAGGAASLETLPSSNWNSNMPPATPRVSQPPASP